MILGSTFVHLVRFVGHVVDGIGGVDTHAALDTPAHFLAEKASHLLFFDQVFYTLVDVAKTVDPLPGKLGNGGQQILMFGLPREVESDGRTVRTSIHKSPVAGPVMVRRHNLDGDRQSDLAVHGGPYKAVYAYPSEHYAFWREQLGVADLPWGAFGENLTTEGLWEADVMSFDPAIEQHLVREAKLQAEYNELTAGANLSFRGQT